MFVMPLSAVDMQSIAPCPIGEYDDGALIVLDGTWAETKSIFIQNQFLNSVKQVMKRSSLQFNFLFVYYHR